MNQNSNKGNGFKVNEFEEERRVYAKCLKREGVEVDGNVASILENQAIFCCKCRSAASPAYAKKFGVIMSNRYFCANCRKNVGKCFICTTVFESDKDISNLHPTFVECKQCSKQ